MSRASPDPDAAPYRHVVARPRRADGDIWAVIAAGWDLLCCNCEAVLGRLFIPFSGGYILHGSTTSLDPRLVERPGRESQTGQGLRRYGPPTRVFARGKRQRSARASRPGLVVNGSFWLNCFRCNAGQGVEPTRVVNRRAT
jgi:hypothetical protein